MCQACSFLQDPCIDVHCTVLCTTIVWLTGFIVFIIIDGFVLHDWQAELFGNTGENPVKICV